MITLWYAFHPASAILIDSEDGMSLQDEPLYDEAMLSNAGDEYKADDNAICVFQCE